jgi:hypothetical protein
MPPESSGGREDAAISGAAALMTGATAAAIDRVVRLEDMLFAGGTRMRNAIIIFIMDS